MSTDQLLAKLPWIGRIFEKSYAFWRANVAIANVTHIVFGVGLTLLAFTELIGYGIILLLFVAIMHTVAFIRGKV